MKRDSLAISGVVAAGARLVVAAGGGGGSSGTGSATPASTGGSAASATTAGVWKGTISSTTVDQSVPVVMLTAQDGHSVWMTTDGRVWEGHVPVTGNHFDATFAGHMSEGAHFPDGTDHCHATIAVDRHSATTTTGHHAGCGDAGVFATSLSPMWNRTASLELVHGVYTRSTSSGYTVTMAIDSQGQMTGSDSRGCLFNGTVTVPDPHRNMYLLDAQLSSCGSLDGHYQGMGTLLDADAMQDWMTAMHPLEHGGHSHGGPMMGGSPMPGHNTVPTGQQNLFMFSMANDHAAIMDALGR